MMRLVVNGERHEHRGCGTLPALLKEIQADNDRVAVMVNGAVIPRDRRESLALQDGDRVEVLVFAGGG